MPDALLDKLCIDCVTEEEFDDLDLCDENDLLDEDGNVTEIGLDCLASYDRKGYFL